MSRLELVYTLATLDEEAILSVGAIAHLMGEADALEVATRALVLRRAILAAKRTEET